MSVKVWSKFSAVAKDGTKLNFRIMDMPDQLLDTVVKLHVEYFVKEESTFKASGVGKNAEALEELNGFFVKIADDNFHITVCCLDNGDDENTEVVGASLMALTTKGEPELPEFECETPQMNKLMELFKGLGDYYDEAKELHTDRYFADRGLFVCPKYRGLGIAQEFLKSRRMICKEHGIPINGAWMTSYGTQKAAERDGWETVCEFQYEEFGKKYGVTFDKEPPTSKFMIARIN